MRQAKIMVLRLCNEVKNVWQVYFKCFILSALHILSILIFPITHKVVIIIINILI